MRTKKEVLKELGKNSQPGAYGGIPPDTRDYIVSEALLDIRDSLRELAQHTLNIQRSLSKGVHYDQGSKSERI